jgi:D-arabinose 1-dehydrogenase-like Zn-dependent alcohol dehydrogenase
MKAARIVNVNEPLQIQEVQTPKPKGSQILIKVQLQMLKDGKIVGRGVINP